MEGAGPQAPLFSVFIFSRPPAPSDPRGRAQTERSITLRPDEAVVVVVNLSETTTVPGQP